MAFSFFKKHLNENCQNPVVKKSFTSQELSTQSSDLLGKPQASNRIPSPVSTSENQNRPSVPDASSTSTLVNESIVGEQMKLRPSHAPSESSECKSTSDKYVSKPTTQESRPPAVIEMDSHMALLYENLQSEASKIQNFKVKVLAEVKQKSGELQMKEQQIKNLSMELLQFRTTNQELMRRTQRQNSLNNDVIHKVVSTREVCFQLANQIEELKDCVTTGATMSTRIDNKILAHSKMVQGLSRQMEEWMADSHSRLEQLEDLAQTKSIQYNELAISSSKCAEGLHSRIVDLESQVQEGSLNIQRKEGDLCELSDELSRSKTAYQTMQMNYEERLTGQRNECESEVAELQSELVNCQQQAKETSDCLKCQYEELWTKYNTSVTKLADVNKKLEEAKKSIESSESEIERCEANIVKLTTENSSLHSANDELESKCGTTERKVEELKAEILDLSLDLESKVEEVEVLKNSLSMAEAHIVEGKSLFEAEKEKLEHEISKQALSLEKSQDEIDQLKLTNQTLDDLLKTKEERISGLQQTLDMKSEEVDGLMKSLENLTRSSSMELSDLHSTLSHSISSFEEKLSGKENEICKLTQELSTLQLEKSDNATEMNQQLDAKQEELEKLLLKLDDAATKQTQIQADKEAMIAEKQNQMKLLKEGMEDMKAELSNKLEEERQNVKELQQELQITKTTLDCSLNDKNVIAASLAEKTQELHEMSNKLLVKDCEFSKLLSAVQNLKSKCAAVATPMSNSNLDSSYCRPNHSVAPLQRSAPQTPESHRPSFAPLTPNQHSTCRKSEQSLNTTPKARSKINPTTPRTPSNLNDSSLGSQDAPRSILKNQGSASKPNRVVFSTPIEESKQTMPSDSDTSVFDVETVNKSLQLKSTPNRIRPVQAAIREESFNKPRTPSSQSKPVNAGTTGPTTPKDSNFPSPNLSQGSAGERLPRSRMIRAQGKKRLSKKEDSFTRSMKRHKALMSKVSGMSRPLGKAGGEDSDCFGFNSD